MALAKMAVWTTCLLFMKSRDRGYKKIHDLVKYYFGKPAECECCGVKQKPIYTTKSYTWLVVWSNVDHRYKESKKDWRGLCGYCHIYYDTMLRSWYEYYDKPQEWHEKRRGILPERRSPSISEQRKWLRAICRSKGTKKI